MTLDSLKSKKVLITGGTGSLGSALVERLVHENVSSITIFSRDELKQHEMELKYAKEGWVKFIIGDVREYNSIYCALQQADIVFHTAALKHVSVCEQNPQQAVMTNILGTVNIINAIRLGDLPVCTVVNVASDKGCSPVNVYGATKFIQEKLMLRANIDCPDTRFVSVCYGNVMGSRGSVIPIFKKQLEEGSPLTITDPNMSRFLISLEQAVDALLVALSNAQRGEIYVPIIPSAMIADVVSVLLDGRDWDIRCIGKGAGEKMHELLITKEEAEHTTQRGNYYVVTTKKQQCPALSKEYVSSDYLISREELKRLFINCGIIADVCR